MTSSILDRLILSSEGRILNLELVRKPEEKYELNTKLETDTDTGSTGLNGLVQNGVKRVGQNPEKNSIYSGTSVK